jgi:tripartite-type tricarboxylate transporter receptor subunit TctC
MLNRSVFPAILLAIVAGVTTSASGATYPEKPIRILTTVPGGSSDFAARLVAQGLTARLGQPVIVDNRGGSIIAIQMVAKAPPDGYTLILYSSSLWLLPFMRENASYDPVRDFAPITLATRSAIVLVVNTGTAAKSVKELVALAKARPGTLNYASGASGSSAHLAAELFKSMAGVNLVRVAYKSNPPALNSIITGEVQIMFPAIAQAMPHVKSGRLRALAVTSAEPNAMAPGLPTVAAEGVPGYESSQILGVFAPAGTPAAIITLLNREIVGVLALPDVKERFLSTGTDVVGSTPQQFAAAVKAEMSSLGKVIKDAGIRDD